MQNPLKNFALSPEVTRDLKVRVLLLGSLVVSVALAWWSINRLPDWEKKIQSQNTKIAQLEDEILNLEKRWSDSEAEEVGARCKTVQDQLLSGHDEVMLWQTNLQRRANQFTLSVNTGVTNTMDCPLPGKRFSIYSATVDVGTISPGVRTNSPYLRLLNFAQSLASDRKRVDLVELSAGGSSNSVPKATLGLQPWALESVP